MFELFDRPKPTVGCSANGRRSGTCMYYLHFVCVALPSVLYGRGNKTVVISLKAFTGWSR